ncbi:MAG: Ig-like domain-containing protein, partial [Planctomycetia bacterium]
MGWSYEYDNNFSDAAYIYIATPTIDLQATSDTGISDSDNVTNENTPTFDITATPYYCIYRDGVQISSDYETASIYTSPPLSDGTYEYTVVAVDEAGNETIVSPMLSVTIDTVAMDVADATLDLQAASDLGISDTDHLTCDNTPTLEVFGSPHFRIFCDGIEIGGYETGSFTTPVLADGTHFFAFIAVDEAGNESAMSDSLAVTIETVAPAAPTLAPDLQAGSDSGIDDTDNVTNDATPTFDLGAPAYFRLYRDDVCVGNYLTSGSFTTQEQPDGTFEYTIVAVDEAGNESLPSPVLEVTIDTQTPWDYFAGELLVDDRFASDRFGYSDVSISGTVAIVGASRDDDNGTNSGSAYIFEQTDTGWVQAAKLTADDAKSGDGFGYSVSICGTMAIVGARSGDGNATVSGAAYIFEQTVAGWTQIAKLTADDGEGGENFGGSVAIDNGIAIVGAYLNDDNGPHAGSAYVFEQTDSGWSQVAMLIPDDVEAYNYFGYDVSISGTTALVGSYGGNANHMDGVAYVYERTDTTWEQTATLIADDAETADLSFFGYSVSISGSVSVVGALGANGDESVSAGAAYVFEKVGTTWQQIDKLTADDGETGDDFGHSVSVSDDMIVAGSHRDDGNVNDSGSAYLFRKVDDAWVQVKKFADETGENDWYLFGRCVAISGTTVIAGTSFKDDLGNTTTSAYMFTNVPAIDLQASSDRGLSNVDNITSDNTPTLDVTSSAYYCLYRDGIQIGGDYQTAASYTSEPLPDGTYQYTVIAVDEAGNETLPSFTLNVTIDTTPLDITDATFGLQASSDTGISDTDNITSDTTPTFEVSGVPYFRIFLDGNEIGGYESGSFTTSALPDGTYHFTIIAVDLAGNESVIGNPLDVTIDTVAPETPVAIPDLQAASDSGIDDADNCTNDSTPTFDIGVAYYYRFYRNTTQISGDYETAGSYTTMSQSDGTYGYAITAVDAAGNESALGPAISVTIDTVSPGPSDYLVAKLLADDGEAGDIFGCSVAIDGNMAIVGACQDDNGYSDTGSAYIFEKTETGWVQMAKLTADDFAASDIFGGSVSISGTTAIVGACQDDNGYSDNGSAYVFEKTETGWVQMAKLTANDAAAGDYFGYSVSISGTTAIVGAYRDDNGYSDNGSAYVFEKTETGWVQMAKLAANDAAAGDDFGYSVSISGTLAMVGAIYDDDAGSSSGSVYVFEQTDTTWTQVAKLTADDSATGDYFGCSVS